MRGLGEKTMKDLKAGKWPTPRRWFNEIVIIAWELGDTEALAKLRKMREVMSYQWTLRNAGAR